MKLKHQWSTSNNFLTGLTADAWWKLLKQNRFSVDPPYWHRAALISVMSVLNSWYRNREENRFATEIEATEISEAPVFILGHWRSGTTHLHNLLCQDTEKFAFPNTYQVVNPHTFLTTEEVNSRRFAGFVPDKRPMDNVELNFQTPQEDEFAPCLMTLLSPYIGVAFPREEEVYERYLTFQEVSLEETEEWKKAMLQMVKKLTLKYQRRLLLKSPTHTARIKLLLEVFPDARFVHIHRNPYDVFQSFLHYYNTAVWYTYMQRPDRSKVKDTILNRYSKLYDAYFDQRHCIPEGHFCELSFDDLERNPLKAVETIYGALSLGDFETVRPKLEGYVESLSGYQKNQHPKLNQEDCLKVSTKWKRSFDEWGYPV